MKKLVVLVLLVAAVSVAYFGLQQNMPPQSGVQLTAPAGKLWCEVAATQSAREAGLSNRTSLCPGCCMLFKFEAPGRPGFWMKDMRFALDVVFLGEGGKVVDVAENLSPCTAQACPVYNPQSDSKYVVEVNAGKAAELGLKSGARVAGIGND